MGKYSKFPARVRGEFRWREKVEVESGRMEQQAYDNKEEGVEAMARQFGAVIGIWLAMAGFSEEVATLRWSGDGEFMSWRW